MEQLEYICPPVYRRMSSLQTMFRNLPGSEVRKMGGWTKQIARKYRFVTAIVAAFILFTVCVPFLLFLAFVVTCVLAGAIISLGFLLGILFTAGISSVTFLLLPLSGGLGIAAINVSIAAALSAVKWVKTRLRCVLLDVLPFPVCLELQRWPWIHGLVALSSEALSSAGRKHKPRSTSHNELDSSESSSAEDSVESRRIHGSQDEDRKKVASPMRQGRAVGQNTRPQVFGKTARELIRYGDQFGLRNPTASKGATVSGLIYDAVDVPKANSSPRPRGCQPFRSTLGARCRSLTHPINYVSRIQLKAEQVWEVPWVAVKNQTAFKKGPAVMSGGSTESDTKSDDDSSK